MEEEVIVFAAESQTSQMHNRHLCIQLSYLPLKQNICGKTTYDI